MQQSFFFIGLSLHRSWQSWIQETTERTGQCSGSKSYRKVVLCRSNKNYFSFPRSIHITVQYRDELSIYSDHVNTWTVPHPNVAATQFAEYKKTNIKVYSNHYVLNIVLDNFSFPHPLLWERLIYVTVLIINYSTAYWHNSSKNK